MERKLYHNLLEWKNNKMKMPYMLVGARQTGKTYILKKFCEKEFEQSIYINLDSMKNINQIFEDTIVPEEIINNIETILNIEIDIDKTILFFDEIQVSERAISSLKYFCESEKNYKIVCAGSLLGVKINRFKSSFPVGKVWIDYLYPMDFEEFLKAIGEDKIIKTIEDAYKELKPLTEPIHNKALDLYNQYMCIGGMPIAIKEYIEKEKEIIKFNDEIEEIILTSYLADMAKYTQNIESIRNNKIYNSIPAQLGNQSNKFQYGKISTDAYLLIVVLQHNFLQ